jgi:hypothetical protein
MDEHRMNLLSIYDLNEKDVIKYVFDCIESGSPQKAIEKIRANKGLNESQKLCIAYSLGQYDIMMQMRPETDLIFSFIESGKHIRETMKKSKPERDKMIDEFDMSEAMVI